MTDTPSAPARQVVALMNSSDDTLEMVRHMLDASGFECLVGCHLADLRNGHIDLGQYLDRHNPDVVIVDMTAPDAELWQFFQTLCTDKAMAGRGLVLTTTNKGRLDEIAGHDSAPFESVAKPYDLDQINAAIRASLRRVRADGRLPGIDHSHDSAA